MKPWLSLLPVLLLSLAAHAEQYVDRGEYRVHYNTLGSTELTPDIARKFGVTRSRNEALLVLSTQRRDDGGTYRPVPAQGEGEVRSLIGHVMPLTLRPVREGDAHYLIAPFAVLDGEFLTVDLKVLPSGASAPVEIKFRQQYYRD